MKKTSIITFISLLILACSKNNLPSITSRNAEPPGQTRKLPADFVANPATGKTIFENRCDRCHGLHEPVEFNAEKWDSILTRMAPRARLNAEQTANVLAYLKENAVK